MSLSSPFHGTQATYDTTGGSPNLSYTYKGEEYTIIFSKRVLRERWGWICDRLQPHYNRITDAQNVCEITLVSRDLKAVPALAALTTLDEVDLPAWHSAACEIQNVII